MNRREFVVAIFAVIGTLFVGACSRSDTHAVPKRFELAGRVVSIDAANGRVTVAHRTIPGFMDAMTMELAVEPPAVLATLTPGDRIRATLVVHDERTWIEGIERLEGERAGFDVDDARDPDIGTPVPAFQLTDQSGRRFGWERFRGKVVLVTFIYSRCPLPDYCVRMTANFESVARLLESDQNDRVVLLCVSIDPEHDTPDVLRAYASEKAPMSGRFDRWMFATGSPDDVRSVARFFGLSYEEQSGQIVHSLRTVVVAPDGRVAAILRGNSWTPEEALAAALAAGT